MPPDDYIIIRNYCPKCGAPHYALPKFAKLCLLAPVSKGVCEHSHPKHRIKRADLTDEQLVELARLGFVLKE